MASLVERPECGNKLSILDPGAGIGLLSAALLEHLEGAGTITAYELEPTFQSGLKETLTRFNGSHIVVARDFIEAAVMAVATGKSPGYDAAILNPPYKKVQSDSRHRALLRKLGVETSNLYTCFLACAIALCKNGAQVVAILPRSWMNGLYFKPFRYWLFEHAALTHVHVFDSRDRAFKDDEVLQENVIVRFLVGRAQGEVEVSASHDQTFADLRRRTVPFSEVVTAGDEELYVHVPAVGAPSTEGLPGRPLREIGLDICTGPVVDFRVRDHLRMTPEKDSAPLLYSSHFAGRRLEWPKYGRKPNAIMVNAETLPWLMPKGCYVVTRRFTSKEERRRVVAYLLDETALHGYKVVGFENHLNVFHNNRGPLEPDLARGLVAYLNSQDVDDYFRTFSGHTQVNATDLRRLRYPSQTELRVLGARTADAQESQRSTEDTD